MKRIHFIAFLLVCLTYAVATGRYWYWFVSHFFLHFDLLHLLLLGIILWVWVRRMRPRWPAVFPVYNPLGLAGVLLGTLALALMHMYTPIRLFGFVTAALLGYSLLSTLMPPASWRRNLVPFALLLLTLPFGRHLDVFIGYPLRMLAVEGAQAALSSLFPALDTTSSLLIVENRASQVDMDCSGLKGLWVGLLAYLIISWAERTRPGILWFGGLVGMLFVLLLGNFFRVVLLSTLHFHENWSVLAPWVHHSTAVFFLLIAVGGSFAFLRQRQRLSENSLTLQRPKTLAWPLLLPCAGLLLTIGLLPRYATQMGEEPSLNIAGELRAQGWRQTPLQPAEQRVYTREGVVGMKYMRDDLQLLLVLQGDWRSQHKPELCYELSGLPLSQFSTKIMAPGLPVRELQFVDRPERAYYWFQSGEAVTEDFAEKVWQQISSPRQDWTLVSILSARGRLPQHELQEIHQLLISKTALP